MGGKCYGQQRKQGDFFDGRSSLFLLDGVYGAPATNKTLAIVFFTAPGIRAAEAALPEAFFGFAIAAGVAQAVAILVFAALFAGKALAIGAVDFVALAVILDR